MKKQPISKYKKSRRQVQVQYLTMDEINEVLKEREENQIQNGLTEEEVNQKLKDMGLAI